MSAQALEIRMAHLEGTYEQIDKRLASIDARMSSLEQRLTSLEQKSDRQFFWILGLVLVSILLPMASHFTGR